MAETNDFIITRAVATRAAQFTIVAEWLWTEKTVAQWDADIAAVELQKEVVSRREADVHHAQGELDVAIEDLHEMTLQGLSMAKGKYRGQPVEAHVLKTLSANSVNRAAVMEEALEWEVAWEELDAAWGPVAGNTLAALTAARAQCAVLQKALVKARTVWRRQTKHLAQLAEQLNDANVAWYSAGVHVFAEGTVAGDLIRGFVPTTYTPSTASKEVPAPVA